MGCCGKGSGKGKSSTTRPSSGKTGGIKKSSSAKVKMTKHVSSKMHSATVQISHAPSGSMRSPWRTGVMAMPKHSSSMGRRMH